MKYTLSEFRANTREAFNTAESGDKVVIERYGVTYLLIREGVTPRDAPTRVFSPAEEERPVVEPQSTPKPATLGSIKEQLEDLGYRYDPHTPGKAFNPRDETYVPYATMNGEVQIG